MLLRSAVISLRKVISSFLGDIIGSRQVRPDAYRLAARAAPVAPLCSKPGGPPHGRDRKGGNRAVPRTDRPPTGTSDSDGDLMTSSLTVLEICAGAGGQS